MVQSQSKDGENFKIITTNQQVIRASSLIAQTDAKTIPVGQMCIHRKSRVIFNKTDF